MEENSQDFLQKNIPYYEAWDSINFIDLGWSQDKKYLVTKNQTSYILRLFKSDKLTEKQVEFNFIKECHDIIPCSKPIECGKVSDISAYGYILLNYVEGKTLEETIETFSTQKQYDLGVIAGKILKKIHELPISNDINQEEILGNLFYKKERQLNQYIEGNYRLPHEEEVISYVKNRLEAIKTQKIVKQHGDFHPGNLILTPQNNIVVIDFNRWDLGDPFEEFLKISLFTVETSPVFALGQIEGYFNNQIPDIFWEQLKFYSLHTSLFSIVWAETFGANDVANMITRYERIYQDYFTKDTLVPRWVEKSLKQLKRSSI